MTESLQRRYAKNNACFGCGPANDKGLRIESFVEGNEVIATWRPQKMHEAFPGVLNGGIVGTLLDCHLNWTAAWHLMQKLGEAAPPCTVTAEYSVKLRRPTPTDAEITLTASVDSIEADRATVRGTLEAQGKVCASCVGLFVAVKEPHPAFHRW